MGETFNHDTDIDGVMLGVIDVVGVIDGVRLNDIEIVIVGVIVGDCERVIDGVGDGFGVLDGVNVWDIDGVIVGDDDMVGVTDGDAVKDNVGVIVGVTDCDCVIVGVTVELGVGDGVINGEEIDVILLNFNIVTIPVVAMFIKSIINLLLSIKIIVGFVSCSPVVALLTNTVIYRLFEFKL